MEPKAASGRPLRVARTLSEVADFRPESHELAPFGAARLLDDLGEGLVHGDSGDIVARQLDLAGVQPAAHRYAKRA